MHVLRESPAYSVCRSDFMAQFLPDSKYVCNKILALAPQNSYYQGTQFIHNHVHVCC